MTYLSLVLISLLLIFGIVLLLRSFLSLQVCALCVAVSATWIVLLVLFYTGTSIDPVLVSILMGGSIVGSLYLLEEKLPEKYHIFRLPFFLTLVSLGYFVVTAATALTPILIVLAIWFLSAVLFFWRHQPGVNKVVKKIINCCKNW